MDRILTSWVWPGRLNDKVTAAVRIGRVIHWCALGFAIFIVLVSAFGMIESGVTEPITYFAVFFAWGSIAMIGRGIRYILAKE